MIAKVIAWGADREASPVINLLVHACMRKVFYAVNAATGG